MNKKLIFNIIYAMIFVLIGFLLGYKIQIANNVNSTTSIYDEYVAINLKNEIKLLRYISVGQIDAGKELLESIADNDISYLGTKFRMGKSDTKVFEALRDAKEYRESHSSHKPNIVISKTIEDIFRRMPKKQGNP